MEKDLDVTLFERGSHKIALTKEEIILEIAADKMTAYYTSLMAAFPKGNNFSTEVIAEVWAGNFCRKSKQTSVGFTYVRFC